MTDPAGLGQWEIHRFDEVTSTMDVAARLMATGDAVRPTVVVADHQTAGRGRADRLWRSAPGTALQMTAILSLRAPIAALGPVPLLVGVAVAEAIERIDPSVGVRLKWPNDVLIDGGKVAGILIVSRSLGDGCVLRIGIGVNLVGVGDAGTGPGAFDHLLREQPHGAAVATLRERLMGEILVRLSVLPAMFPEGAVGAALGCWTRRATLLGDEVTVQDGERAISGVLLGVDGRGALRIETAPGVVTAVVAGELTRGPRLRGSGYPRLAD